ESLLESQGHYLSGMLAYGGEWYWGLDRLHHLEKRIIDLSKLDQSPKFNKAIQRFCQYEVGDKSISDSAPIEVVFSSRSPYSYIGLVKAKKLAEHYGVPLIVKPVLPMVMRRMQVPKRKGQYIIHDVVREADSFDIPFGKIADPLGQGVQNIYSLYAWANEQDRGVDLLISAAKANWSEGIWSDHEPGLRTIVERAGLSWQDAKKQLDNDQWQHMVQENLAELYGLRHWGVPCFKYRDKMVFGQDRLDSIEQSLIAELELSA
ncbi:MAG: DsbA family protein, partial [Pseudomonadota bacterium]